MPSRAAAPNGSRPRLPPTDSRSATTSRRARAAAGWSVNDETTTGARSRRTSLSTSAQVGHGHAVVTDVHPHRGDAVLEVVEHGRAGHGGVRVVVELAHVPRGRRVAQGPPAGERHRPGHPERAVLAQVEGVDLEAALEAAAQGGLRLRPVEAGVLGAALVEHGGDETPATPRDPAPGSRPPGRRSARRAGWGSGRWSGRPTSPSSCSLSCGRRLRCRRGRPCHAPDSAGRRWRCAVGTDPSRARGPSLVVPVRVLTERLGTPGGPAVRRGGGCREVP